MSSQFAREEELPLGIKISKSDFIIRESNSDGADFEVYTELPKSSGLWLWVSDNQKEFDLSKLSHSSFDLYLRQYMTLLGVPHSRHRENRLREFLEKGETII